MLVYKIDVIEELRKVGINTTTARQSGVFAQATMKKFKEKDTTISLDNLNRLCCVLEMATTRYNKICRDGRGQRKNNL